MDFYLFFTTIDFVWFINYFLTAIKINQFFNSTNIEIDFFPLN